jgi:hypothetical protein
MQFSDAIDAIAKAAPMISPVSPKCSLRSTLSEVLSPELIDTCLEEASVATMCKRRLPPYLLLTHLFPM